MINLKREILWILPHKFAHKKIYKSAFKENIDLDNPKKLNEKIHWLILNRYGKKETMLTDKYRVREYVKEKGYAENLIKIYKVYNNVNEIKYEDLPSKFVLKCNHDSGNVFICTDKNKFDFEKIKVKLDKIQKTNFAKGFLEYHYSGIKPLIICEEYIEDGTGRNPTDYKFFCFKGKVDCVLVCADRENGMKRDYYNLNWNYLNYAKEEYRSNKIVQKPENFDKMIEIASNLSKEFPFVRVDLYNCNGKIYFGELTFTPSAGLNKTITEEADEYLGSLIEL